MDITIKNVSPDMAKAIELLASKTDVGCGPKIEVEVREDAPKKYKPLGELKTREIVHNGNKIQAILDSNGLVLATNFHRCSDSMDNIISLHFEHQTYKRAMRIVEMINNGLEDTPNYDIQRGSYIHGEAQEIIADLDAGPKE